jgi:hypothetical protein
MPSTKAWKTWHEICKEMSPSQILLSKASTCFATWLCALSNSSFASTLCRYLQTIAAQREESLIFYTTNHHGWLCTLCRYLQENKLEELPLHSFQGLISLKILWVSQHVVLTSYACMYVCMCMSICVALWVSRHVVFTSYACMYVCMCICLYVRPCECHDMLCSHHMHACMYVCVYVYM